jgi:Pyridoxamine 5'-phosphate oxidase
MDEGDDLIPERECWELLASASVGRIALSIHALPAIFPVQYHLDGRNLALCLGHHQLPERALNAVVAFAADAIDPASRTGWSVQVQGQASSLRQPMAGDFCGQPTGGQVVQIEPGTISGHRVHLCPFIDSLRSGNLAPGPAANGGAWPGSQGPRTRLPRPDVNRP